MKFPWQARACSASTRSDMANPLAGEVEVVLDGVPHVGKLTLGALSELEAELGAESMIALVERFEISQSVYRRDPWADLSTPSETPKWAPLADLTLEAAE